LCPDTRRWSDRHRAADESKARFLLRGLNEAGYVLATKEAL
jgi:hypothetical protein